MHESYCTFNGIKLKRRFYIFFLFYSNNSSLTALLLKSLSQENSINDENVSFINGNEIKLIDVELHMLLFLSA